jgi:hypothetical protein
LTMMILSRSSQSTIDYSFKNKKRNNKKLTSGMPTGPDRRHHQGSVLLAPFFR